MNNKKQLAINLLASGIAFILNIGISFFLTPYIIKSVGVEAYGFVSLAGNFINYASLITIALNSMVGRFITIEIHRDNWEAANKYFSSVVIANIVVIGIMLIPSIACVAYIDKIINVPENILTDVRILFVFLFANFLISLAVSSFGIATFARNKLYLQSLRGIEANIIRAILLIVLFVYFKPAVSYLGFTAFIALIYCISFNLYYTKKLLPEIKINRTYFDLEAVIELISSGIWNTIIRVGQLLLEGIDLLISNLYISATAMGTLALAKTAPTLIITIVGMIAGVFMPDFTILYAQNKTEELLVSLKRSMKLLGVIVNIPIAILVSFGDGFYSLWVPTQDAKLLQVLSIITIATIVISGPINSIYGVFTVTNKLKVNAMLLLLTGLVNVIIVLILLKITNLELYAIAGVSSVLGVIRNLVFTAPFGAKYLGLKWSTFFPEIIKGIIAFAIVAVIGVSINYLFDINSWLTLIIAAGITALAGFVINLVVILDQPERKYLFHAIKDRWLVNSERK